MAKVSYIEVPPDLVDRYSQTFAPVYKTKNSSIRWLGGLTPPRQKIKTSTKSLLPEITTLWQGLTTTQQAAWKSAAAQQSYSSWNGFVQDTAYRLKNGLIGLSTPSTLHFYKCGHVDINSPATAFSIVQVHPVQYFVMKKVKGTKSQREPVAVNEILNLPLQIGISYRSNLTSVGANPYAKFYASIVYSYQGNDLTENLEVPLSLVSDWTRETSTLTAVVGHARYYTLVIEFNDVQGAFEFDALQSTHDGTNFARDFRCNDIDSGFSNYNYQLPPSWEAVAAVTGADFGSVYPASTL